MGPCPIEVERSCSIREMTFKQIVIASFNSMVLGSIKKPNMKFWGAFQNPLVPNYSLMLLFMDMVVLVLRCLLAKDQVMGTWKNPWYLLKAKGGLIKPLDFLV